MDDLRSRHLNQLDSVLAKELVKNFEAEDQYYKSLIKEAIARRFGPKSSFRELLNHANEFLIADKGLDPKTKWMDVCRESIEERKDLITRQEWGDLIESQKWFFETNLARVPNYLDEKTIAILCKERPECFTEYKGREEFIKKYLSTNERVKVDLQIRPEELKSLPTRGIVELFLSGYVHRKALRKEVRSRLGLESQIPFADFIETASEFLSADPGDDPVSDWRQKFRIKMDGLHKDLGMAEWGNLIDKHKWYFRHDTSTLKN